MTGLWRLLGTLVLWAGAAALSAALWFGIPITGIAVLQPVEVRGGLIAAVLVALAALSLWRRRARRRAAAALEDSLVRAAPGDGAVLAERMQGALARLKQTGGATALYDLPWYVLIGPPGAGKTTALVHSGLSFPGTDPVAVAGVGGTRNCDFWFADDAVLIDTAGRYTTQDSDAVADGASWAAFLDQLKTARPDQPINGVILALSCADLMTAGAAGLSHHAQTLRARLEELHETLRVQVPVYVIFTKADMVAGFRDYFALFDEGRRRGVWGTTFQTRNRRAETFREVPAAFDALIARLSDEVTDRIAEERDSATRLSIFGFPGQMALLEPAVSRLLAEVFDQGRSPQAILRGFYFTSGTQEGTPIDQVLGAMAGPGAAQAAFLSGRGKSFFLHDLLAKVIFAERDWVGYDRRRVLRRLVLRGAGKLVVAVACLGMMGWIAASFWNNATLVRAADQQAGVYAAAAAPFLDQRYVDTAATRPILPALDAARAIPGGYVAAADAPAVPELGLSRRVVVRGAAVAAYSDSLERLLRPRMMVLAERMLAQAVQDDRSRAAYDALKVYILLAKEQEGPGDDLAIQSFFAAAWAPEYGTPGADASYRAINGHLAAMLALDDRVSPPIKPNKALVDRARAALAEVPLAERAYAAVRARVGRVPAYRLSEDVPGLVTTDARPAATLAVPGVFTNRGYWRAFQEALASAPAALEADAWVLGQGIDAPPEVLARLIEDVHSAYARDFAAQWAAQLGRISGDTDPGTLAALVAAVDRQTRLSATFGTVEFETNTLIKIQSFTPDISEPVLRRRAEEVQAPFAAWHNLARGGVAPLADGLAALAQDPGRWPGLAARLGTLPDALQRIVGRAGQGAAAQVLAAEVLPFCAAQIAPFYPFSSGQPLPVADFRAYFGPEGRLARFDTLFSGVPRGPDAAAELTAGRAVGAALAGSKTLVLTLAQTSEAVAAVTVDHGQGPALLEGPLRLRWPEDMARLTFAVESDAGIVTTLDMPQGPWAPVALLRAAQAVTPTAEGVQVDLSVGAHTLRLGLAIDGQADLPFAAALWSDFRCLERLE